MLKYKTQNFFLVRFFFKNNFSSSYKLIPFLLILLSPIILFFPSCNTTEPTIDNTPPGKRNYIWSTDSISPPGIPYLQSIWGSSPTDVWGAGFSEDVRDCLWHFNGISWKRATEGTPITELGNGSKIVGGIWGTAQNDVWAFGGRLFSSPERTEPFVMHYDGSRWIEVLGDKSKMPDGFTDIYGIGKDHFWVSSSDHVCEYKNGVWKKYFIGENYFVQSISGIGSSIYLTAYPIGVDTLFLMKFAGTKFIAIDGTKLLGATKFEQNGLLFANSKAYTFGRGVFTAILNGEEIISDNWNRDLSVTTGGFGNSFKISSKDIWGIGYPSIVYQYNGENWMQIFSDNQNIQAGFMGIWGNGSEIFISDLENNIIYHGK